MTVKVLLRVTDDEEEEKEDDEYDVSDDDDDNDDNNIKVKYLELLIVNLVKSSSG